MEIRPATLDDLEAVERLNLQVFASVSKGLMDHLPLETQVQTRINLRRASGDPVEGLLVVTDGDRLVGSIEVETREMSPRRGWAHLKALRPLGLLRAWQVLLTWAVVSYRPAPHEAYLHGMVIDPAYRRQGLARRLTLAAEEQARRYGKSLTVALISPDNAPSLALIKRCGYHRSNHRLDILHRLIKRGQAFIRMEKSLAEEQHPGRSAEVML